MAEQVASPYYGIPLQRGKSAHIQIPHGITIDDVERVKKWLDTMSDVLTQEIETKPTYLQPRKKENSNGQTNQTATN